MPAMFLRLLLLLMPISLALRYYFHAPAIWVFAAGVLAIIPLATSKSVTLHNYGGTIDLIADLAGYFLPASGQGNKTQQWQEFASLK